MWQHPALPGALTVSGNDGDDAQPYQERNVQVAIAEADQRDAKA